jgi:hypothetical protein
LFGNFTPGVKIGIGNMASLDHHQTEIYGQTFNPIFGFRWTPDPQIA